MNWFYQVTIAISLSVVLFTKVSIGAEAPTSKVIGELDFRPSWSTQAGSVGTEDSLEAGYQFSKVFSLTYAQGFLTNVSNPAADASGANIKADVGFLRARVNDVAQLGDSGIKLSYQARLYTPTSGTAIDSGMITAVRNYFNLQKELIPETLKLTLSEIPVLYVYDRPGSGDYANPIVENRLYLVADVNLMKDLSLTVPLFFYQTRYSNYREDAAFNAAWSYNLWTWPEIDYKLTEAVTVGLAYYSGNLVKPDLSGFALGDGLEQGVVQTVFMASF